MNNFSGERNRRSLLDFTPIHFPISNYSTSAQTKMEMKNTFKETFFANNLHRIPDPLKKNLANSVITGEDKTTNMGKTKEFVSQKPERPQQRDYYPSLAGITSFFSGVLNIMGLFQRRATSPVSQYCYESDYDERQMASDYWQNPKYEVQNKNERDCNTNMDGEFLDCRLATPLCEKITQTNLYSEFQPIIQKEVFADSVEETHDDFDIGLFNDCYLEYFCPSGYQEPELCKTDSPKVKTEVFNVSVDIENLPTNTKTDLNESMDVEKHAPEVNNTDIANKSQEIVSSCEDKISKLRALLLCRQNKNNESLNESNHVAKPLDIPSADSKTTQPNETVFGNEIDSSDLTDSFNEVSGKFYSSSVDSEDSFQIVFTDSPQNFGRRRMPSDCESEDSFIVFEETPEHCYTNNDVFGDDDSSDSDSAIEDTRCTTKLSPNLSRTFSDLTDTSLYSEDVVDYAVKCDDVHENSQRCTGLLLNEKRKQEKKTQPTKTVRFSSQPPRVHVMRVWAFAARQARAGHWERHALDRERFKRRIADVEMAISWVLKPQHRSRVLFQRFMPWWNAERRRELAEKKLEEESNNKDDYVNEMKEEGGEVAGDKEKGLNNEAGDEVNGDELTEEKQQEELRREDDKVNGEDAIFNDFGNALNAVTDSEARKHEYKDKVIDDEEIDSNHDAIDQLDGSGGKDQVKTSSNTIDKNLDT